MYIITVYGWEDRAATRLVVGCLGMAERVEAMMLARGYILKIVKATEAPDRSQEEVARGERMVTMLATALGGVTS